MKYFISDCHIGDGGPTDEYKAREGHFVGLVEKIIEEKEGDEVQELIILGDVIDFLEIPPPLEIPENTGLNEQAVIQLEDYVFKAHPDTFDALGRLADNDNSIFYVWGNHDYPLRFGKVNESLAQRILKPARDRTDYGKFTVGDYYLNRGMKLFAEHGHRFDPVNLHRDGKEPLGSLLVRDFLRKWENKCFKGNVYDVFGDQMADLLGSDIGTEHFDGDVRPFSVLRTVRPRSHILDFIRRLIRLGIFPPEVREEILHGLSRVLDEAGYGAGSWMLNLMGQPGLKGLRSLVLRLGATEHTPKNLRKGAQKTLESICNEKDLDYKPQICIMGHSHFIDARSFPDHKFIPKVDNMQLDRGLCYYFNLASWIDVTLVDRNGSVGTHFRECPYLRLRREKGGTITADLKDASRPGHPPIDLEKYRRKFLEYETDFE